MRSSYCGSCLAAGMQNTHVAARHSCFDLSSQLTRFPSGEQIQVQKHFSVGMHVYSQAIYRGWQLAWAWPSWWGCCVRGPGLIIFASTCDCGMLSYERQRFSESGYFSQPKAFVELRPEAMADIAGAVEDEKQSRVGNYSLDGLWIAWENTMVIRQRLREMNTLIVQFDPKLQLEVVPSTGHVAKSVHSLRANRAVLSPLLNLIRINQFLLPNLDRLIAQVQTLYERNNCQLKDAGDIYYHNAKSLRALCSLTKGELARVTAEVQQGKYKRKDSSCFKNRNIPTL